MSESLAKCLERHLAGLIVGPPVFDRTGQLTNMVVYPLLPGWLGPDPPDVVALSEGLRKGVRVSDTGLVDRVHIDNPLPAAVLVGESELLIGPTQTRALQFSCLVPPHRRASLPVSCVEESQPTQSQALFDQTTACPWSLRSFKMDLLARHGQMHQHRIWNRVREYLNTSQTQSDTGAVQSVFAQHAAAVDRLDPLFPPCPGQVGAVCAVGHDLFVEVYGEPELLEDGYRRILDSATIEAVVHPGRESLPPEEVPQFLEQLVEVSRHSRVVQSRSLKGQGRSLVFSSLGISGSALIAGDNLVHLCAHKRCWGSGQPFASVVGSLEQARAAWEEERPGFLDHLECDYTERRRRYQEYKARLAPCVAPGEPVGRPQTWGPRVAGASGPPPPRPLPLNQSLHDFFLRLFRRSA